LTIVIVKEVIFLVFFYFYFLWGKCSHFSCLKDQKCQYMQRKCSCREFNSIGWNIMSRGLNHKHLVYSPLRRESLINKTK